MIGQDGTNENPARDASDEQLLSEILLRKMARPIKDTTKARRWLIERPTQAAPSHGKRGGRAAGEITTADAKAAFRAIGAESGRADEQSGEQADSEARP